MDLYKIIGCIPERFNADHDTALLELLCRIFPSFSDKEKAEFVGVIRQQYCTYEEEKRVQDCRRTLADIEAELQGGLCQEKCLKTKDDVLGCIKYYESAIEKKNHNKNKLLALLDANDIVPIYLPIAHI